MWGWDGEVGAILVEQLSWLCHLGGGDFEIYYDGDYYYRDQSFNRYPRLQVKKKNRWISRESGRVRYPSRSGPYSVRWPLHLK